MERTFYFAYNTHIDAYQLRTIGIRVFSSCCCCLHDHQLEFNVLEDEYFRFETRGIPNIVPYLGGKVEGILYEMDDKDLSLLDREAGVGDMKYYRKYVDISIDRKKIKAYAYAAWPDVTSQGLSPNKKLLHQILYAAKKAGMSFEYQQWLQTKYNVSAV